MRQPGWVRITQVHWQLGSHQGWWHIPEAIQKDEKMNNIEAYASKLFAASVGQEDSIAIYWDWRYLKWVWYGAVREKRSLGLTLPSVHRASQAWSTWVFLWNGSDRERSQRQCHFAQSAPCHYLQKEERGCQSEYETEWGVNPVLLWKTKKCLACRITDRGRKNGLR